MNRKQTNRTRKYLPILEVLETRSLMAAGISATFGKGVLTINGTNGPDTIHVNEVNQRIVIDNTKILVSGKSVGSVPAAQVSLIVVNGKGGSDDISLSNDVNCVSRPARINGGDGNDVLSGGLASDKIYGGNGNDFLYGYDGFDYLYGQAGNDQLYGGIGSADKLDGGPGQNILDDSTNNGTGHIYSSDSVDSHAYQSAASPPGFSGSLYPTYLDAAIGPNDTTIKLGGTDTGAGDVPFLIQIDGEILRVIHVESSASWVVVRGTNGTTRQSHAAGASIISANVVDQGGTGGTNTGPGGTGNTGGETGGQGGQQNTRIPPAIIAPISTAGSVTPTFSWTPVAGARRYEIFVADPTGSKVLNPQDISGSVTTWVASSALVSGTKYTWWVRAIVYNDGKDVWSEPKTFQVTGWTSGTAPFAPENLSYQQQNRTDIILSWSNVAGETGYTVAYWDGTGWTEFTRTGADVTSTTITNGVGHYFRVGAYNGNGANYSKYLVATDGGGGTMGGTTGGSTGYTSAPTGLTWSPTAGTNGILTWSNVDGESGYVIEYWANQKWNQFAQTNADVTTLTVTAGSGNYLRVGAIGRNGIVYSKYVLATGAADGSSNGGTGSTTSAPDAPSGLRWAANDGTNGTLSWTNVNGETGYVIEYWNGSAWSRFATTAANVNSLYVTSGAGRYLRVGAYNGIGTTYSDYISTGDGTSGATGGSSSNNASAPTAPQQVRWSTTTGKDGNLSWTNSTGETSYVLEYWNGSAWIQFGTAAADVTAFYITNGVGNFLRVGARNSYGTTYSDYIQAQ